MQPDSVHQFVFTPKTGAVRFYQDDLWHVMNPKNKQYKDYLSIATQWFDGTKWQDIDAAKTAELQRA